MRLPFFKIINTEGWSAIFKGRSAEQYAVCTVLKLNISGFLFQKHFSKTYQKKAPVHVLPRDALREHIQCHILKKCVSFFLFLSFFMSFRPDPYPGFFGRALFKFYFHFSKRNPKNFGSRMDAYSK